MRGVIAVAVLLAGSVVQAQVGAGYPRLTLPSGSPVAMAGYSNGNGNTQYVIGRPGDPEIWRATLGHSPTLIRETGHVWGRGAYDPVAKRWALPTRTLFRGQWVAKGQATFENGATITIVVPN